MTDKRGTQGSQSDYHRETGSHSQADGVRFDGGTTPGRDRHRILVSCVASWLDIPLYSQLRVSPQVNTENYRSPSLRRGSVGRKRPPHSESPGSRTHRPDQKNLIARVMRGCEHQFRHTTLSITVSHPASIVASTVNRIPTLTAYGESRRKPCALARG